MNEQEKLAILMADRQRTERTLELLELGQAQLRSSLDKLPEELGKTIREECVTRREFRTAKGAFGVIAVIVSTIISMLSYALRLGQ